MSGPDKDKETPRSGRVRHEPGGRAIWEWAVESGKHAIDSTSRLLKKLDITSLRVLGEDEKPWKKDEPRPRELELQDEASRTRRDLPTFGGEREKDSLANQRKSFNPYDSRTTTGRGAARPPAPAAPPKPRITQPVRPEKKPGLLARMFGQDKK